MIHVMITDLHSHISSPDAVLSLDPSDLSDKSDPSQIPSKAPLFTCGLHPWNADRFSPELLDKLRQMLGRPGCLGLGEAGLDAMRGPAIDLQTAVFEAQARLAIEMELPMVIHCVRAHEPLIALYRRLRPARPWIIHGFRGKPAVARRLLDAGLSLSLGPRFNTETARIIPLERLFIETDAMTPDSPSIASVAQAISLARATTPEVLLLHSAQAIQSLRLPAN